MGGPADRDAGSVFAKAPLRFRLGAPADFAACMDVLWPGDPAAGRRDSLPALWTLCRGRGTFAVVESLDEGATKRIHGFGMSVFARSPFCDRFFACPTYGMNEAFYRALDAGEDVLLSDREIAVANATSGIDVLVLHFGSRFTDFSDPATLAVTSVGSAAFFFTHGGYRIRTILFETYDPGTRAFMEQGQFHILKDHATSAELASGPADERRCIFGSRREWARPGAVNPFQQLFFFDAPHIRFGGTERRVLELALLNQSDEGIARALGLSQDTIRKTWRRILERTADTLPALMPSDGGVQGVRGREKRRFVLDYVRAHLEELRPYKKV